MLRRLWSWISPHARRARVQEVFGELLEACESYVLAGLEQDAARVLERLADDPELAPQVRLRHYERATEMLGRTATEPQERLAGKMLPLLREAAPGTAPFRRRVELLRLLGRSRELGAELERAEDYAGAMQAYVEAGLLEEIDRIAELAAASRERRAQMERLFEELERGRSQGDRLIELRALRSLVAGAGAGGCGASLPADLQRLERRLLGSPLVLEGAGLRGPVEIHVAQSMTLGRDSDADVRIAAPGVSRRHARLYAHEGRLYVEDLDSRNGTWIDGIRLEGYAQFGSRADLGLGSEVHIELAELPRSGPGAPALLVHGRPLGRAVVLLCGELALGAGSGPLGLQHPALEGDRGVFRLVPAEGELLVAPLDGGPAVLLGGKPLEQAQLPLTEEPLTVRGVGFTLRRLEVGPAGAATTHGDGPSR
jgi:hypothetical protein